MDFIHRPIDETIKNQIVLMRSGYDIPTLKDLSRIRVSCDSIRTLLEQNNTIILCTKWSSIKSKEDKIKFSTAHLLEVLSKTINKSLSYKTINEKVNLVYINQFDSFTKAKDLIDTLHKKNQEQDTKTVQKTIILLENIHFDKRENSKNVKERLEIAKEYAGLASSYVDECFISSHRMEATNTEIKELLPTYYGKHYLLEVENLEKLKTGYQKPYIIVLGGAKIETKLPLLEKMLEKADKVLLGGLISLTFIQAAKNKGLINVYIPPNQVEEEFLQRASDILDKFLYKICLPIDLIYETDNNGIHARDIGQKTINLYKDKLATAKTIFWNGPMGYYEKPPYNLGTLELATYIATQDEQFSVIGGGDTCASLPKIMKERLDYISEGGGATLEYLSK
jgi:phosphoglycerate kinase